MGFDRFREIRRGNITNFPDVLYKFAQRKYAIQMVTMGVFRFGTLYDFRNAAKHGALIGDSGEGTKTVVEKMAPGIYTADKLSWVARAAGMYMDDKSSVELYGVIANAHFTSPDCFMYCFSETSDRSVIAKTNYNACVEIRDLKRFIGAISIAGGLYPRFALQPCFYGSRQEDINEASPKRQLFLKELENLHQREWRAVWAPGSASPEVPFNVLSGAAAELCRIVWMDGEQIDADTGTNSASASTETHDKSIVCESNARQ